jgi:hypothetical protein
MSLVKFRNLNSETQKKGSPKAQQDLKLSFSKLAATQGSSVVSRRTGVTTRTNSNGGKRKGLYDKACIYLNSVLNAVKNRKSFALDPGFQILQKIAEVDHPRDALFIMAIHLDDRFKYVIHHSVNVAMRQCCDICP